MAEIKQENIEEKYNILKIEAIEELQDYNILKREIYNLSKKIQLIDNKFSMGQAVGYSERVQTFGNGYENAVANMLNVKTDLENQLAKKKEQIAIIDETLFNLEQTYRQLLDFRYIKGWSVSKMERKYFLDRTTLYRKIQKALAQYIFCKNGVYIEKYKKECRNIEFNYKE